MKPWLPRRVADLVYVSSGHITVWINQDGNAWSDPIVIHGTPPVTDATAVRLADMLGTRHRRHSVDL